MEIKYKIAGIVLYNPDIKRLKENIDSIVSQVDEVLLVDNASLNINEVKCNYNSEKITIIENDHNKGIAFALNQICQYAFDNKYEWVLTLDQDSVASTNIISTYELYTSSLRVALISCNIVDRNFRIKENNDLTVKNVSSAITSGSYVNTKIWKEVNGFDEKMFIDFVDIDYCTTLIEHGYNILRVGSTSVLHELGRSRKLPFLKNQILYNHSAFRYYFLIRNRLYYARKHKNSVSVLRNFIAVIWRSFLIIVFEGNKIKNTRAIYRGMRDGFKTSVK